MADPNPRYILVESVGVEIKLPATPGGAPLLREWLILDRYYCHEVVWQWRGWASPSAVAEAERGRRKAPIAGGIAKRRQRAENECRRMNAEHEEWLARGCIS